MWVLIILIITPGVCSGDLGVTLKSQCALQGTSVVFKCEYDYSFGHIVTSVSWSKVQIISGRNALIPLSEIHSSPYHFTYLGNYRGNCDLKVNNVQLSDDGQYSFGFKTTLTTRRTEKSAYLFVRGLTAVVEPSTVTEGDTVRLTCRSGCPESTEIVWFKDGKRVSSQSFLANRENAGRFHCAVLGQEGVQSAPVALKVYYTPRNVMLSLSPSGDIIKGSTVIFTCSSDAHPPVSQSGYSLYKDGKFISSGSSHIIQSIQISQRGLYHCQAQNSISWRDSNQSNSSALHLDVLYAPLNVSVSVNQNHITVGSSVNLTCSSDANPAAENYTWFKRTESPTSNLLVQVGSGQVLFLPSMEPSHAGLYLCHVSNKLGGNNSTEMMLVMTEDQQGFDFLAVLAVIGIFLLLMLGIALLFFWKKQKYNADKKPLELSGRTSNTEDPPESLYSNISPASVQAPISFEDGSIYTTVIIKPRKQNPRNNKKNKRRPQDSWFKEQENDSSVIYSTLAKSS